MFRNITKDKIWKIVGGHLNNEKYAVGNGSDMREIMILSQYSNRIMCSSLEQPYRKFLAHCQAYKDYKRNKENTPIEIDKKEGSLAYPNIYMMVLITPSNKSLREYLDERKQNPYKILKLNDFEDFIAYTDGIHNYDDEDYTQTLDKNINNIKKNLEFLSKEGEYKHLLNGYEKKTYSELCSILYNNPKINNSHENIEKTHYIKLGLNHICKLFLKCHDDDTQEPLFISYEEFVNHDSKYLQNEYSLSRQDIENLKFQVNKFNEMFTSSWENKNVCVPGKSYRNTSKFTYSNKTLCEWSQKLGICYNNKLIQSNNYDLIHTQIIEDVRYLLSYFLEKIRIDMNNDIDNNGEILEEKLNGLILQHNSLPFSLHNPLHNPLDNIANNL